MYLLFTGVTNSPKISSGWGVGPKKNRTLFRRHRRRRHGPGHDAAGRVSPVDGKGEHGVRPRGVLIGQRPGARAVLRGRRDINTKENTRNGNSIKLKTINQKSRAEIQFLRIENTCIHLVSRNSFFSSKKTQTNKNTKSPCLCHKAFDLSSNESNRKQYPLFWGKMDFETKKMYLNAI